MKRGLIILGSFFLFLLTTALVIPIFLKDSVLQKVNNTIDASIRAKVEFADIDLTFFKSFPHLTLIVEEVSIAGIEQFEGDTLISASHIAISLNPFQAILSDKPSIKRVELDDPKFLIKILDDGSANYDIAVPSEAESSGEPEYSLEVKNWTIVDGDLTYDDQQSGLLLNLKNINHAGSGDFTQDLFDLQTSTKADIALLQFSGINYLTNKELSADATLAMNLGESKFAFRDNKISLNDFTFGFDGWFAMPNDSDNIVMDLTFGTTKNSFQSLLSLVPGIYGEGFENISSDGQIIFKGAINGTYNEHQLPAFDLQMQVEDGMFKFPELPSAVEHVNLSMSIENNSGDLGKTQIEINPMHIEFGENPLDGSLSIKGLATPEIKADLNVAVDLADITSLFPVDGTTLRGQYDLSLNAEGVYDSVNQKFPVVQASMTLKDGFIKSDQFPTSLEQFQFTSEVVNLSGKLSDTRIEIPQFDFVMDGEKFGGHLTLINPDDYSWDLKVAGGVDLGKIAQVLSLQEMELAGVLRGNLESIGTLSSLDAAQYQDIPTAGDFVLQNFSYNDQDLLYPIEITTGRATFNPEQIVLTDVKVKSGTSDISINGELSDYISYMFSEEVPVRGALKVVSDHINMNEWMTETNSTAEEQDLSVMEIPTNLDFTLSASAGNVLYDNMTLRNVKGDILIKHGKAYLSDLSFNSLGGGFLVSGTYDPTDLKNPSFAFEVEMQEVAFREAFNTFNTVKVLAPVTQIIDGDFSSSFKIDGNLQQDMMPNLSTLSGKGLLNIATAALSAADSKLIKGLSEMTSFNDAPGGITMKDVIMAVKIEDGQMDVAPFTVLYGDYETKVSGSTGIDGKINFNLDMEVPAGTLGASVNNAIATLAGNNQPVDDKINLNLNLGGTYQEPKFMLGGASKGSTASQAKAAFDQRKQETKDSINRIASEESEKLVQSAQQQIDSLFTKGDGDTTNVNIAKEATKEILSKENVDNVLNLFKKRKSQSQDQNETDDNSNQ